MILYIVEYIYRTDENIKRCRFAYLLYVLVVLSRSSIKILSLAGEVPAFDARYADGAVCQRYLSYLFGGLLGYLSHVTQDLARCWVR